MGKKLRTLRLQEVHPELLKSKDSAVIIKEQITVTNSTYLKNQIQSGMQAIIDSPFTLQEVEQVSGREIVIDGKRFIDFATSSYLALENNIDDEDIAVAKDWGSRNGWSRISAITTPTRELEKQIAHALRFDCVRLAQSISLINQGLFYFLSESHPLIFADKDIHITLKMGLKAASKNSSIRFWRHNSIEHLEALLSQQDHSTKKLIIVDGIYSMKGDAAPIKQLTDLCEHYNAMLVIDDAHGFGLCGESGYGVTESLQPQNLKRIIYIGSFSKCAGQPVGFVAFDESLKNEFDRTAPFLIYSGPPSNIHTAIATRLFRSFKCDTIKLRRQKIEQLSKDIHTFCELQNITTLSSSGSPILAVTIDPNRFENISHQFYNHGIYLKPAIFPVVRHGDEIFRFTITAGHSHEDLHKLKKALLSIKGYQRCRIKTLKN